MVVSFSFTSMDCGIVFEKLMRVVFGMVHALALHRFGMQWGMFGMVSLHVIVVPRILSFRSQILSL